MRNSRDDDGDVLRSLGAILLFKLISISFFIKIQLCFIKLCFPYAAILCGIHKPPKLGNSEQVEQSNFRTYESYRKF